MIQRKTLLQLMAATLLACSTELSAYGLPSLLPKFQWCLTCEALEVFTEECRIGEVQFLGNLGDGLIGVHQLNLDACDKGAVYPFLGGDAAGLADDCA